MSERVGGTVTFMFTDIEGSTTLLKQLGRAEYGALLAAQQLLVREAIAANGGEEIDTQGGLVLRRVSERRQRSLRGGRDRARPA